jgi:hypothetical protein
MCHNMIGVDVTLDSFYRTEVGCALGLFFVLNYHNELATNFYTPIS